jgi:hypothetical protein
LRKRLRDFGFPRGEAPKKAPFEEVLENLRVENSKEKVASGSL